MRKVLSLCAACVIVAVMVRLMLLVASAGSAEQTQLVVASPSCGDVGGCPTNYWTLDRTLVNSAWGKWKEVVFSTPFPSTWQHDIYSGSPRWFTREYTGDTSANGWIDWTRVRWSDWWTASPWTPWIGGRGSVSAGYHRGFYPGSGYRTYTHHRRFNMTIPSGKLVKSARLYAWADTAGCFWINNNPVESGCTSASQPGAVNGWQQPVLLIGCAGRGSHQRTQLNKYGFPRGYCMDHKYAHGFRTGDLVRPEVPGGKHAGVHVGYVSVRAKGSFAIKTAARKVDGISHCHCHLLQRVDGYNYTSRPAPVWDAGIKLDIHTKKGGRAISLPAEPGSLLAQSLCNVASF